MGLPLLLLLVFFGALPLVQPQEIFDPIVYYPAITSFDNLHLPYVASVGCKEVGSTGITDTEININTATLTFTSENLPEDVPAGQTYAHVDLGPAPLLGGRWMDSGDSWQVHMFVCVSYLCLCVV